MLRDVGEMKALSFCSSPLKNFTLLHSDASASKRVQRTINNKEAATQGFQPLRTHPVALPDYTQERYINKQRRGSRQTSGNRCEFVILTSDLSEQEINFLHESQDRLRTKARTAARLFLLSQGQKVDPTWLQKEGVTWGCWRARGGSSSGGRVCSPEERQHDIISIKPAEGTEKFSLISALFPPRLRRARTHKHTRSHTPSCWC